MTSEVDTDSSPDEYAVYHSILESGRQHSKNIHVYFFVFFKFKTGSFICSIIDIRFSRLTAQITGSQNVFLSVLNKMCPAGDESVSTSLVILTSFLPALTALILCKISGEGWDNLMLSFHTVSPA